MCGIEGSCVHPPRLIVPVVPSPEKQLACGHSPGVSSPYALPTPARELESAVARGAAGKPLFFPT